MWPKFELLTPSTISEASELSMSYGQNARYLAGGTDLFVQMHEKKLAMNYLIDLTGISDIAGINVLPDGSAKIGSLTTFTEIVNNDYICNNYPALVDAASKVGSVQVRNLATIGGNLCNAIPSADSAPALMACNAQVEISDGKKNRNLPLEQFLLGVRKTALNPGELLSAIFMPPPVKNFASAYYKFSRRKAMDLALLGVAVSMTVENNIFSDVRIALGTAAPTAIRVREAEDFMRNKPLSDEIIIEAAKLAASVSNPRSSYRASGKYRKQLIQSLIPRVFATARERHERKVG